MCNASQEYADTVEAIKEGLQDVEAGRVEPFERFDERFRRKHNIPSPTSRSTTDEGSGTT